MRLFSVSNPIFNPRTGINMRARELIKLLASNDSHA